MHRKDGGKQISHPVPAEGQGIEAAFPQLLNPATDVATCGAVSHKHHKEAHGHHIKSATKRKFVWRGWRQIFQTIHHAKEVLETFCDVTRVAIVNDGVWFLTVEIRRKVECYQVCSQQVETRGELLVLVKDVWCEA